MNRYFFLFFLLAASCGQKGNTIRPEVKSLIEAVYSSGHVVAKDEYEVFAQAEGYVLEKVIDDGNEIKRGAPLFILESGQQSSRFDLAKKNYNIAVNNYSDQSPVLKESVAAMQTSKSKMQYDSVNYHRYKNLLDRNAISQGDFDRMRLNYDNSKTDYLFQQSRYEKIKNQLFLELENAKSQLAIAGNEAGKYIIRSEADGRVFKTLKEKGELIRRGEAVAIIGSEDKFFLELSVDELDIKRVKKGQEVLVSIDALSGKVYKATVEKIYPFVNRQQQSIRVDAVLQDSLSLFVSGLAVEANIIIQQKDKALVVPRNVLVGRDSLRIRSNGDIKTIPVTKGIETLEEVEILQGIDSETEVVTNR